MAYNIQLADQVRAYLATVPGITIEEKKMFGGLAFLVNGKMCINIGDDQLMCRFDPALTDEIALRTGFLPMIMKGKEYKGYCYVEPSGFKTKKDFAYWMKLCLDFNHSAKAVTKTKKR